ncbi:hypothetical protein [Pseudomonas sp. CYM-20-01]|uniref:hypothetical protein n=1 Tax=Pseudomonas sp. CYM-20-01 TaxID=2870750 RepID=UPI0020BD9CD4|nr:hypothetical protein [Pseudomonas sp. CYM-20-01]
MKNTITALCVIYLSMAFFSHTTLAGPAHQDTILLADSAEDREANQRLIERLEREQAERQREAIERDNANHPTPAAPSQDSACLTAWKSSSAYHSCIASTSGISTASNGQCHINVSCPGADTSERPSLIGNSVLEYNHSKDNPQTVPLSDVSKLVNCHGTLRLSSC